MVGACEKNEWEMDSKTNRELLMKWGRGVGMHSSNEVEDDDYDGLTFS